MPGARVSLSYLHRGRRAVVDRVPAAAAHSGLVPGDRIRMQRHFTDEGVFIRSIATRGHLGGPGLAACLQQGDLALGLGILKGLARGGQIGGLCHRQFLAGDLQAGVGFHQRVKVDMAFRGQLVQEEVDPLVAQMHGDILALQG